MQFAGFGSNFSMMKLAAPLMHHKLKSTSDTFVAFAMASTALAFLALLDTDQLLFMSMGAAGYLAFHTLQQKPKQAPRKHKAVNARDHIFEASHRINSKPKHVSKEFRASSTTGAATSGISSGSPRQGSLLGRQHDSLSEQRLSRAVSFCAPDNKQGAPQLSAPVPAAFAKEGDTKMPRPGGHITAPKLQASGIDAEVPEFLAQICPTAADDAAIGRIVRYVTQAISPVFPEAEVLGFASAKLTGSGAFGVAVPEVDLVIDLNPVVVLRRLQRCDASLDENKLRKHVLRKCAGRLVERAGFKFRRSAFGGPDPKVTLMLPSSAGLFPEPIPLDVSVNSAGPLRASALLTECGAIDPRAKALILLVRRWAKDRGVSHAARGHLSPYAWSVLVVYFLQVGVPDVPILPPFHRFKAGGAAAIPKRRGSLTDCDLTVSQLFIEFFRFYAVKPVLQCEVVSVLDAVRSSPNEQASNLPVIDDPFEPSRNLAEGIQRASLERMHEELARAHTMCSAKCSLTDLLEPWLPPEALRAGSEEKAQPGSSDDMGMSM